MNHEGAVVKAFMLPHRQKRYLGSLSHKAQECRLIASDPTARFEC
jgi:hypothetical protein